MSMKTAWITLLVVLVLCGGAGSLHSQSGSWTLAGTNLTYLLGNVGLGTETPSSRLEIVAGDALSIAGPRPLLSMRDTSEFGVISPPRRYFQVVGDDLHVLYRRACNSFPCPAVEGHLVIKGDGNVGIGTTTPGAKLDVVGGVRATSVTAGSARVNALDSGSTRTGVLEITGGADIAEPFKITSQSVPKGAIVVIDDRQPGSLRMSTDAYDRRVAGIVSGANGVEPGIRLRQEGVLDGGEHVALSGRVYALADASRGRIVPGDLLTTSPTPGHAMKVTDHSRAQGAVLGKAMSSLEGGQGLVLVLVTLQ